VLSVAEVTGLESQFLGQKNPLQKQAIAVQGARHKPELLKLRA
jgi:hypothetical protein